MFKTAVKNIDSWDVYNLFYELTIIIFRATAHSSLHSSNSTFDINHNSLCPVLATCIFLLMVSLSRLKLKRKTQRVRTCEIEIDVDHFSYDSHSFTLLILISLPSRRSEARKQNRRPGASLKRNTKFAIYATCPQKRNTKWKSSLFIFTYCVKHEVDRKHGPIGRPIFTAL